MVLKQTRWQRRFWQNALVNCWDILDNGWLSLPQYRLIFMYLWWKISLCTQLITCDNNGGLKPLLVLFTFTCVKTSRPLLLHANWHYLLQIQGIHKRVTVCPRPFHLVNVLHLYSLNKTFILFRCRVLQSNMYVSDRIAKDIGMRWRKREWTLERHSAGVEKKFKKEKRLSVRKLARQVIKK